MDVGTKLTSAGAAVLLACCLAYCALPDLLHEENAVLVVVMR